MSTSPTAPTTAPMTTAMALTFAAIACDKRADWFEDQILGDHTDADDFCREMADAYRTAAAHMAQMQKAAP